MEPMGRADPQAQVNTPWPNSSDPFLERSGFRVWGGGGVTWRDGGLSEGSCFWHYQNNGTMRVNCCKGLRIQGLGDLVNTGSKRPELDPNRS